MSVTSQISDLSVREGRSTGKMLIMTNESTYTNQNGEVVAKQRGQAIFY